MPCTPLPRFLNPMNILLQLVWCQKRLRLLLVECFYHQVAWIPHHHHSSCRPRWTSIPPDYRVKSAKQPSCLSVAIHEVCTRCRLPPSLLISTSDIHEFTVTKFANFRGKVAMTSPGPSMSDLFSSSPKSVVPRPSRRPLSRKVEWYKNWAMLLLKRQSSSPPQVDSAPSQSTAPKGLSTADLHRFIAP
jgi:hypothetical protein